MPRRAAKLLSAVVKATTPKKIKGRGRAFARRVAQGTLLAVTLAASQMDSENPDEKKRLFDPSLVTRLRAPITRYHE